MKRKHTSVADTPMKVVIVTLDNHLSSALSRAEARLRQQVPGLTLRIHAASVYENDAEALAACHADIADANIIVATMLFMEPHFKPVLDQLAARRDDCDAMVCCMSAAEVMRFTRMGRFAMDREPTGIAALLKRLRGSSGNSKQSKGAQQLSVLKQLPRILRFIPGTAQDVRAYFLSLQYWLAGSEDNLERMVAFLINRYAAGEREVLREALTTAAPIDYPDTGVYHPGLPTPIVDSIKPLMKSRRKVTGTVGVLVMRSYALSGNTRHYDAVIAALEARGLRVIPAFASGLDSRPAIRKFFMDKGGSTVDAVVSMTGFSLVGGPAYNDSAAAAAMLRELDVPYLAVQALEFQSLDTWATSSQGLMPIEATLMVAIPELDGATGPMVFGGRHDGGTDAHDMAPQPERVETLAERVSQLVRLRREKRARRKVAVVLFNFPPNAGATGTAASLSVYRSLYNTLAGMREAGYTVNMPESVDALREAILHGNAAQYGMDANVHAVIPVDQHVAKEKHLAEIEAQWGPAPGRSLTDGRSLFVLGAEFGNVLVAVQPPMGYEGDPMRLLFEGGFAPTHAFSAFYRYLRDDYAANAVLHFGTHGALEFMPGKQVGMSADCWPDRLIGALPNFYLYAANNPSEGLIAKRRSAATLISYLTPSITRVDLYRGLQDLNASVERWRGRDANLGDEQRADLAALIQSQAAACDLAAAEPLWDTAAAPAAIEALRLQLLEIEDTLIPFGLHVVGEPAPEAERRELLKAVASAGHELSLSETCIDAVMAGDARSVASMLPHEDNDARDVAARSLVNTAELLGRDHELAALIHALDGGFVAPVVGGDLLQTQDILPTGRNLHGFDPYRLPSLFSVREGRRQADQLLARHRDEVGKLPESVALVLWGTDNLKSEGVAIAQALALMGAEPRLDGYGRIVGASLVPLDTLGRPRIDVVLTLSGIFRDLLPLQTRMLAEAAWLAASADEDPAQNHIRRNALAYQAEHGCDLDAAALRVFSNCEGAYGSNVNMMVDAGSWQDEDELAEAYTNRKCFAYGRDGKPAQQPELLTGLLARVDLAYQNLDSVELGVTTIDHYFDTLGGISRAASKASGTDIPIYISDQTTGQGRVRTLSEQVALETRTRVLNPQWYESMLEHGFEGVRAIESHITNTVGWSATTGQVAPWVYQQLSETFILNDAMRKRLAALNPQAAAKVADRLLEAQERQYWSPDDACLDALRKAGEDLDDWLEGITGEVAA